MGKKGLENTEVLQRGKDGTSKLPAAMLVMIKGENAGREFRLEKSRVTLGREADITLADTACSREHAAIILEDKVWKVTDLGSTNGTELNGETVKKQKLEHGDKITIGRTVLQFILDDAKDDSGVVHQLEMDE